MQTAGVQTGSGNISLRNISNTRHCEAKLIGWFKYLFCSWKYDIYMHVYMFARLVDRSL